MEFQQFSLFDFISLIRVRGVSNVLRKLPARGVGLARVACPLSPRPLRPIVGSVGSVGGIGGSPTFGANAPNTPGGAFPPLRRCGLGWARWWARWWARFPHHPPFPLTLIGSGRALGTIFCHVGQVGSKFEPRRSVPIRWEYVSFASWRYFMVFADSSASLVLKSVDVIRPGGANS